MSLHLEHIKQKFGSTPVLNDINLVIRPSEFLAILGPSGCGKTTLLRIIGGFLKPTSGTVRLDGTVYSDSSVMVPIENRDLGMVFQSFALWPHMTVREHVEFPLKSRKKADWPAEKKEAAVAQAIHDMGLDALADRYPGELSGGQRQRVSLARAIVSKPSILLMDEPLSALDAELKINMRKEIQDIHRRTGAIIIYVTHDQSEALAMADRILVMRYGVIEQLGTPEEIYTHPESEFVATFVSKCNLLHGTWQGSDFHVAGHPFVYPDTGIACPLKEKGLYPVRPEQFHITYDGPGLEATITNRQFHGREIHYAVTCGKEEFQVFARSGEVFFPGESVRLVFTA